MKKRILCVLLTLIMLISLVPATAITASAASNAISESAILVLKQLEGYQMTCENGYIGYGAKCPECLGKTGVNAPVDGCPNVMYEKEADTILRAELKELDKAVNAFASKNGLSLSQSKHDALVMFSFQNGSAWTIGTGALQSAIKSGYTGTKFVDAICKWNYSPADDARRMVEANMYLNGIYSSKTPSRYIGVEFVVDGGAMEADKYQYFDVASPCTISLSAKPNNADDTFLGWYTKEDGGERVTVLNSTHAAMYAKNAPELLKLYAVWQAKDAEPGSGSTVVAYTVNKAALISTAVYNVPNGTKVTTYINEYNKEVKITLGDKLNVVADYVDEKGVFWAKIVADVEDKTLPMPTIGWVQVKGGAAAVPGSDMTMDLTVTVTNSYVNMRSNASAASAKTGSFNYGQKLRIINVQNASNGTLWGQVAKSAEDTTPIGWVALMYTDYDSVVAAANSGAASNNGTVVATATITYTGYVNVRSEAGINNQIVGSLSQGTTVDLYEIKYVNGIQWGRCSAGWFCLSYANVTRLVADNTIASGVGFSNYVFSGVINNYVDGTDNFVESFEFYTSPYGDGKKVESQKVKDKNGVEKAVPMAGKEVTLSNLIEVNGEDWGKTAYGWTKIDNITLDVAKFYVIAETLTVREDPDVASARKDLLIKGTEFDVNMIDVVGETVWGKANKVGENVDPTYGGWVNLSNENVSRNGAPEVNVGGSGSSATGTVTMAKVVGTDSLNVRITGSTSGKKIGTLSYGTTAAVLAENNGWYNLDIDVDGDPSTGSWVSGTYLEIYEGTPNTGSNTTTGGTAAVLTGTGIVANTYTGVNIRTGAGTAYAAVGKYMTGTTVEILEVKTVGAAKWGRTEKGWVCMDYIVMMENFNPNGSGNGTGSTTTTTSVAIYTGKLTAPATIYKETATNTLSKPIGEIVRADLPVDYPVTVHEIIVQEEYEEVEDPGETNEGATTTIKKRTTYWARVNDGYIFAPGSCIALDTLDEHVYTLANAVKDITNLGNVGKATFDLAKGDQVIVTKLRIENSDVWGYIECDKGEGEIKMSNMTKGFASSVAPETEKEETNTDSSANTGNTGNTGSTGPVIGSTGNTTNGYANANGYKYTGKVINTNSVNVRATASTGANITTTLKNGAALVIYETVISDGMAWGRCDAGWVYLYYVDLTPAANGAVDARVVYNDNTVIYSDMGMTTASGSTYAKMAVIDIYEIVGKMARTELGWVHTDNLL